VGQLSEGARWSAGEVGDQDDLDIQAHGEPGEGPGGVEAGEAAADDQDPPLAGMSPAISARSFNGRRCGVMQRSGCG